MTLSVRLHQELQAALERHCKERGVTKSAVVQTSLAAYLRGENTKHPPSASRGKVGSVYESFRKAGLTGGGKLYGKVADKKGVSAKAKARILRERAGPTQ